MQQTRAVNGTDCGVLGLMAVLLLCVCVYVLVQVAYHASRALLQYIRAHLLIHLTALQRRLRDGPVGFLSFACVRAPSVLFCVGDMGSSLQAASGGRGGVSAGCSWGHLGGGYMPSCNSACVASISRVFVCLWSHWTKRPVQQCCRMSHRPPCRHCCCMPCAGPLRCPSAPQAHQHQCSSSRGAHHCCVNRRKAGRGIRAHKVRHLLGLEVSAASICRCHLART